MVNVVIDEVIAVFKFFAGVKVDIYTSPMGQRFYHAIKTTNGSIKASALPHARV